MLLSLLIAPALAAPEYHLEASAQLLPDTVALDTRFRMEGEHDGYVMAAARLDPSGTWIGRTGIGFDVFGGGTGVDLRLGLFLGGTGDWTEPSLYGRPAAGAEAELAVRIRRVYGSFRHMDGFAGPLEDRLTEDELRLGFRVTDHVKVHGQWLMLNPGDQTWRPSVGIGAETIF